MIKQDWWPDDEKNSFIFHIPTCQWWGRKNYD